MADRAPDALISSDVGAYLAAQSAKPLIRVITCGSVDDGKSTLIGRLLFETHQVFDDQMAALTTDSARIGTQGANLDFALLVDGLSAEREQGITIDVAYRFVSTPRAKLIIADCPGHEQYTRNMVTGASTADAAIVLVDARKGILTQTRRHSFLVSLLGIRNVVLAVNKMDLIGYDRATFDAICDEYRDFAASIGIETITCVPISGLIGDNITAISPVNTPWYSGKTLLGHLEAIEMSADADTNRPFRMPVQWVNRPDQDFRGFAGLVASGQIRPGDAVRLLPSGRTTTISRIVAATGDLAAAQAGQSITLTLADDVDCARGDVIVAAHDPPQVADQFEATLVWMDETPLLPGRSYLLKLATQTVAVTVQPPKYTINVNTLEQMAAKSLELNAIGVAAITTARPIVFEPYATSRSLGGFILIDRATHATVAAGMIHFALRRSQNLHLQASAVTRNDHATQKIQRAKVVWLTGLSGAGKSTIADLIEQRLYAAGRHSFLLDGDNVRHRLNKDLGFSDADRIENIRRVGEVARLMTDAGLIVITAFISPFRAERRMVREMMAPGEFWEVHIDTPLADAEARDVKGLYKKARTGQLANFTGIDSPYEAPETCEIRIDTTLMTADAAADLIVARLLADSE